MSQLNEIAAPTGPPRGTAIFVHGLGGDAFATWRAKPDEEALWPRWLAQDISGVAVFSVGYRAAVSNWQGTAMPLQDRAGNVLEGLLVDLEKLRGPIVFVCHSLGGLVVKQLLREANDIQQGREEAAELLRRVRGVVFMATPHSGSELASVLDSFRTILRVSAATESLIKNDPTLRNLNTWYRDWSLRSAIRHRVFFESIASHGVITVDPGSADPGLFEAKPIAIDADHIHICKPESREDLVYKSTRDFIASIARTFIDPSTPPEGNSDPRQARVFISHSRKDGTEFAKKLHADLSAEHLSIWRDTVALEGGRDWWSQIEEVLKSKTLQHFVLVITQAALASPIVRRELRLARQEGKTICPVKGPGLGELNELPRWLGQIYDLDLPEHRTALIRTLQDQSQQRRVAMMAPEPPANLVQRPLEFEALKKRLLDAKGDAVAITAALRGAGGYGKTTLAKALAHDPDVQDAYFDGILWVELGERPENLLSIISDLITILTGSPPQLATISAAVSALGETLGDRRILMIVDDVWREQDLRPFLQAGPNTTRLVTTRIDGVLPAEASRQPVDAMLDQEARNLLAWNLPPIQIAAQNSEMGSLVARLGEWPLLLKIVNGFLHDRVVRSRQPLAQAIAGVNKRLDDKGLVAFDARNESDRNKAVARTIGVSLELLDSSGRERFAELCVFPEDTDVPIGILVLLWSETGNLDEEDTEDFLSELFGLSLLLDLNLDQRTFRLHDVVRHFLQDQAGKEGLAGHQKALVRAMETVSALVSVDGPTRRYFYLNLPYHLAQAGKREALDALLLNPGWLKAKLAATGDPHALIADYDRHATDQPQKFIGRTLRLTAGILARDRSQLIPQLLGRLPASASVVETGFLAEARSHISTPAILTQHLSLYPHAGETARLEGYFAGPLCLLPKGRLASPCLDETIQLWDVETGTVIRRLDGHVYWATALCVLPDGRLAAGSQGDKAIRLWDIDTGIETRRLQSRLGAVDPLCVLSDGRLASGGGDGCLIQLWDLQTGCPTACLDEKSHRTTALCLLPDGRLASASTPVLKDDISWVGVIRLWDVQTGVETSCLRPEQDSGSVRALCVLLDGRLAAGSDDGLIRLWDVQTGKETGILRGHLRTLWALCVLPDGRLASGSSDRTIRLWDVKTCSEAFRLDGHADAVGGLCMLPDGRLASGSRDHTLRLWDVDATEVSRREGHSNSITALCLLPDGRLASGSYDGTIRLWDVRTATETDRLEANAAVNALCVLPDGRLASASQDNAIRLWDVRTCTETAKFEVRPHWVWALCALSDGRLVSASQDNTIGLWNVETGAETTPFNGHKRLADPRQIMNNVRTLCALPDGRLALRSTENTIGLWSVESGTMIASLRGDGNGINALCLLPDGRLASATWTIRLWDLETATETVLTEGYIGQVCALCVLRDGRLASGSDDRAIRLWDTNSLREIARLEVDGSVTALAALPDGRVVAGDNLGNLHWLEIVS
jgi:WD40 repeat protein